MADPLTDKIIDGILQREGGYVNDKDDKGGRTFLGISEKSNAAAWADGKVTEEEARAIYQKKYVEAPGFMKITDPQLRMQLIDYGVTSGPAIAIQKLQEIVGIQVDGVLGQATADAVNMLVPRDVGNALVVKRVLMVCRFVQSHPDQGKYLVGWSSRAMEFIQ